MKEIMFEGLKHSQDKNTESNTNILNSTNSNLKILENSVYYNGKAYVSLNQFKKITGIMIEPNHYIYQLQDKDKLKCDDPLICSLHGNNTYVWFISREACMFILNRIKNNSIQNDKFTARKNINLFFDNEEAIIKAPYRALIDISLGTDCNNQMNFYTSCSDMILALKNIYESEKIRESLSGEEEVTIKIKIDKTMVQRQKL